MSKSEDAFKKGTVYEFMGTYGMGSISGGIAFFIGTSLADAIHATKKTETRIIPVEFLVVGP